MNLIDHTFRIRVVNVQKVIEVPRSGIKSLDNISLIIMVKRIMVISVIGGTREGVEDNALKEWKRSIFTIVDKRIKLITYNTPNYDYHKKIRNYINSP